MMILHIINRMYYILVIILVIMIINKQFLWYKQLNRYISVSNKSTFTIKYSSFTDKDKIQVIVSSQNKDKRGECRSVSVQCRQLMQDLGDWARHLRRWLAAPTATDNCDCQYSAGSYSGDHHIQLIYNKQGRFLNCFVSHWVRLTLWQKDQDSLTLSHIVNKFNVSTLNSKFSSRALVFSIFFVSETRLFCWSPPLLWPSISLSSVSQPK